MFRFEYAVRKAGLVRVKIRTWLNALLILVPATGVAWYFAQRSANAGQLTVVVFALALGALVPLASLIGTFTDRLETYLGDRAGGLIGASFANVPELAIGISLLIDAHVHAQTTLTVSSDLDVIRGLLLGSVINNVLFVLGSSIFIAALRNGRMNFSAESAAGYSSMLALAVVGLVLPVLATSLIPGDQQSRTAIALKISVPFGIILILSYAAYIAATIFKVGAHKQKKVVEEEERAAAREESSRGVSSEGRVMAEGMLLTPDEGTYETELQKTIEADEQEEQIERKKLAELRRKNPYAVTLSLIGLAIVTVVTVIMAIMLVSVTDTVIAQTPLTSLSVGLIIFPIVCNLGEQASSILNAWHDHMEGAMSVAAGSSVQVALFVTPVLVLLSYILATGNSHLVLTLIFSPLELIVVGLVAFVYTLVSQDGETTWLEGLQLLAFYAMIVAVALLLPGR
jgi:Ca2+:H+ antiporter